MTDGAAVSMIPNDCSSFSTGGRFENRRVYDEIDRLGV